MPVGGGCGRRGGRRRTVGGVDATCANSRMLGEFDDTLCGTRRIKAVGRLGAGRTRPRPVRSSMRTASRSPFSFDDGDDVEVFPRRCAQPDMVSIADVSACGHSSGRSGAAIAAPTAAMG